MRTDEIVKAREQIDHSAFVDLFRAAAIIVVVGVHLSGYFFGSGRYEGAGIVAVNGFFVLSGFLLAGSYLRAILKPTLAFPSWKTYALRRLVRIYPAYALAVVATAAPYFFARNNHGVSIFDVVAHLTMTHGFFTKFTQSAFNVPLWTMAVDAQFYVLLPMVAFFLRYIAAKMEPSRRHALILGTLGLCIVASLVIRLWVYRVTPAMDDFSVALVYARNVIGLGSSFAFGVAIAYARLEGRRPSRFLSVGFVALACACTTLLIANGAQLSHDYLVQVTYDFVGAVGAAAILYGLGLSDFRSIHKISALPVVTWIAQMSYCVYLYHKPFSNVAVHFIGHHIREFTPSYGLAVTMFTVTCSVLVAMLVYRYVEVPSHAFKGRVAPRTEGEGAAVEASLGGARA